MPDFPPPPPPPSWGTPPPGPPPPPPAPPGWQPPPPGSSPPPPPSKPRRPVWFGPLITAAIGLAGLGAVVGVSRLLGDDGVDHPDDWDPRVLELVEYVEDERGLEFDHPVYIDFLTPDEYRAEATTDEATLTDEDRDSLASSAGELRALGVGSGDIDLLAAINEVADAGTLAYYDPREKRVSVRGTEMTVGLEVTLVHELTHALQDQHFDLVRLYDEDLDGGASLALRALIEGDAGRIEQAYVDGALSSAEREEYEAELAESIQASEDATADVPTFIQASFAVPYALGPPFVQMLANEGGNGAVDAAFRDPPDSEEDLFDPASYLDGEDEEDVELGLDEDEVEIIDEDRFGSSGWYLMLSERIDPMEAFQAALGWGGDAYASFRRDGVVCVRAVFRGDTAADEDEMIAALDDWVAAMPDGAAEFITVDGRPGFESCDPGSDVEIELRNQSTAALNVPALWGYLIADAANVVDAEGARCYASAVVGQLTFEEIIDPEGKAFSDEAFVTKLQEAFRGCL